jgi:homogentisate 1,2-dioxygenase
LPFYVKQGKIPSKRHSVFKKPNGDLYYEELMGRQGFSGNSTNMYHLQMPTRVVKVGALESFVPVAADAEHRHRHIKTFEAKSGGDAVGARRLMLFNSDVLIHACHADSDMEDFYRNAHFDELFYVQKGGGTLECQLGTLELREGDYLVIPRGIIFRIKLNGPSRLLVVESASPYYPPSRYRSRSGQFLEHSPFCERDIRVPVLGDAVDQKGTFTVRSRIDRGVQAYEYENHPFDVVGWDGFHYPWAFNINDFEPIVGSIHQPPTVHQTFETAGFVVCSFVSRPFDFHPDAIPAPYPHSNLDSDEVLFYSMGNFMSRRGISQESMTLHPMGLAHGPHPGRYEGSIGKKATEELAVMIDTFKPLFVSKEAVSLDDSNYPLSWVDTSKD